MELRAHNFKDESGQTYGQLKVLAFAGVSNRAARWECRCSCNRVVQVTGHDLRRGHTHRCKSCAAASAALGCIGKTVGSLKANRYIPGTKDSEGQFECTCACGNSYTCTVSRFHKSSACDLCQKALKEAALKIECEKRARAHKISLDACTISGEADCHVCGKHFTYTMHEKTAALLTKRLANRYCSKECRKKRRTVTRRHMYRARAAGSKVINRVDMFAVFERDGWICQECGLPAPRELYGKNLPDSPECDHIKAFRIGGDNVESNVRLIHRKCQIEKAKNFDAPWAAVYDYFGLWKRFAERDPNVVTP